MEKNTMFARYYKEKGYKNRSVHSSSYKYKVQTNIARISTKTA